MPPRGRKLNYQTGLVELTEDMEKFLDWLCGDRPEGQSQNAFARELGVSPKTLTGWKRDPSFRQMWEDRLRSTHAAPDVINDHLKALNQKAQKGDVQAIKLYHEIVARMWPEDRDTDEDLIDLSDQELADLAESMDLLRQSED